MKVVNVFLKSLFAVFAMAMFTGCDEESEPIPYFPISEVKKCERDDIKMEMSYGRDGLSAYSRSINGGPVKTTGVYYSASKISCEIDNIIYEVQLSSTRGSRRAESVTAREKGARSTLYEVEYFYDEQSHRLRQARINGGEFPKPVYAIYRYEGNSVIINDGSDGQVYTLVLSNEDNKGYVCNVLDFAGSPLTSKYVIHPDLYFLNIYGIPFGKLPDGVDFEYTNGGQNLLRVGKYTYSY